MIVNVLGIPYSVEFCPEWEDAALAENAGYCDRTLHKIVIAGEIAKHTMNVGDIEADKRRVLRHEIVHAFLFESGMSGWSHDELLVEWIATQMPRMAIAMNSAGALTCEE